MAAVVALTACEPAGDFNTSTVAYTTDEAGTRELERQGVDVAWLSCGASYRDGGNGDGSADGGSGKNDGASGDGGKNDGGSGDGSQDGGKNDGGSGDGSHDGGKNDGGSGDGSHDGGKNDGGSGDGSQDGGKNDGGGGDGGSTTGNSVVDVDCQGETKDGRDITLKGWVTQVVEGECVRGDLVAKVGDKEWFRLDVIGDCTPDDEPTTVPSWTPSDDGHQGDGQGDGDHQGDGGWQQPGPAVTETVTKTVWCREDPGCWPDGK